MPHLRVHGEVAGVDGAVDEVVEVEPEPDAHAAFFGEGDQIGDDGFVADLRQLIGPVHVCCELDVLLEGVEIVLPGGRPPCSPGGHAGLDP